MLVLGQCSPGKESERQICMMFSQEPTSLFSPTGENKLSYASSLGSEEFVILSSVEADEGWEQTGFGILRSPSTWSSSCFLLNASFLGSEGYHNITRWYCSGQQYNAGDHILRNWLVTKAVRSDSLGYIFYWKASKATQKKNTNCTGFHSTLN